MRNRFLTFFLVALVALLYYGCTKPKTYPDIPSIQFVSLTKESNIEGQDSAAVITISFTDGDGNIGFQPIPPGNGAILDNDSINGKPNPYYYDFIVSFFEKDNGVWVQDIPCDSCAGFNERMPYLTPEGSNKALSGQISLSEQIRFTQLYRTLNDTIHYQVYIYDRALHQSNTITTSDLVISIQ